MDTNLKANAKVEGGERLSPTTERLPVHGCWLIKDI